MVQQLKYDERELQRLKTVPRYQVMTTSLLGFPVKIVDAFSFLGMVNDIFHVAAYRFEARSSVPYIIDAGSNIGLSVIYFKQLYPCSEVIAFEPDQDIFAVLEENISRYPKVTTVRAAVSTSNAQVGFLVERSWAGRLSRDGEEPTYSVSTVRLRDYLIRHVDFLKLDIEGAETDVLFDCADLLPCIDHLFCEYHSFAGQAQRLGRLLTLLTDTGFRFYIHSYKKSSPFLRRNLTANEMDVQVNIFAKHQRCENM